MLKKMLAVLFCVVFVLGVSSMAIAKKAVEEDEAVKSEPASAGYKDKLSMAFNLPGGIVSGRMWLTNSLGLDFLGGLKVNYGSSGFGFTAGANMIFPVMEEKNLNIYLTPGLIADCIFGTTSPDVNYSDINFSFSVSIEAETFVVKNVLSVGGSFGLRLGVDIDSSTNTAPDPDVTTSNTEFSMGLGSPTGLLFMRVYI